MKSRIRIVRQHLLFNNFQTKSRLKSHSAAANKAASLNGVIIFLTYGRIICLRKRALAPYRCCRLLRFVSRAVGYGSFPVLE